MEEVPERRKGMEEGERQNQVRLRWRVSVEGLKRMRVDKE